VKILIFSCMQNARISIFFRTIIFCTLLLCSNSELRSEIQSSRSVIDEALALELYNEKEWLFLVQYWNTILGQITSRVDDPDYFLSKEGKTSPRKELRATLEALIESQDLDEDTNPQCRFAARFLWLDEKLKLLENGIVKKASCIRYSSWKESLAVKKIFLIFPSAYLNNPASMFGHTLFRLDSEKSLSNPLLSYAANFGAATGSDGGVLFAVKGLLGGYPASFSVEPYYETVQRYGDIEHRDIWEYELLLEDHEIERFLSLLWELGSTYFNYYFFDENCSFYVLALLDFVRPELSLLEDFSYWVIPSDTLKAVTSRDGFVGNRRFRPSLSTRLEMSSENLSRSQIRSAKEVAKGKKKALSFASDSHEDTARVLEFSFDYLEFLNSKRKMTEEESRKSAMGILTERSKLDPLPPLFVPEPEAKPEDTHDSGRMILSGGARDRTGFYQISIKPAYHDVLDKPDGFKNGAAIDFFHASFRHYEGGRFEVQSFLPVAIESYTPWSNVFSPISWDVATGLDRELIPKEHKRNIEGSLLGFFETSGGVTLPLFYSSTVSALLSLRGNVAPAYSSSDYAVGGGPKLRFLVPLFEDLRIIAEGQAFEYVLGENHTNYIALSEFQYDISLASWTKGSFVRGGIRYERSFGGQIREGSIGVGWYF
jgi:hypothetical protein